MTEVLETWAFGKPGWYTLKRRGWVRVKTYPEDPDYLLDYSTAHKAVTQTKRDLKALFNVKAPLTQERRDRKHIIDSCIDSVLPKYKRVEWNDFFGRLYEAEKKVLVQLQYPYVEDQEQSNES